MAVVKAGSYELKRREMSGTGQSFVSPLRMAIVPPMHALLLSPHILWFVSVVVTSINGGLDKAIYAAVDVDGNQIGRKGYH